MTIPVSALIALASLLVTLLGSLVMLTWRSASHAARLLATVQQLERRDDELMAKILMLDKLPSIEQRLTYAEKHNSIIPKLAADIDVLKAKAEFSREMRQVTLRRSRPDIDED